MKSGAINATGTIFLTLIGHDLRLVGRRVAAMTRGGSGRRTMVFVAIALAIFHALAWPVAASLADEIAHDPRAADTAVAGALAFVMPWIVSQALMNSTRALYARGDLDLLLASPAPATAVFAARALAIAIESCVSVAIFLLPVANMLAVFGGLRWLAIYPLLAFCGLLGTAIGLLLTIGLFKIAGPRRTRTLAQVFAALVGASFALGIQAANFAPTWLVEAARVRLQSLRASTFGEILSVPVRAAGGDLLALAWSGCVATALFVLVSVFVGSAFTHGLAHTSDVTRIGRARKPCAFRSGPGVALRRKEWRLLRRDPWLPSQLLLQATYTLPLCFVLWQTLGPEQGPAVAISPAVVVIAAQIAGALAWIALSTEDAPELLATAPLTAGTIARAKLGAVAGPVAALLAVPLLAMLVHAPWAGLATAFCGAAAASSTALLNLWRPAPGKRGDALRRHGQPKIVGILEHALALCWAITVALMLGGSPIFIAPMLLATVVLFASRPAPAEQTSGA